MPYGLVLGHGFLCDSPPYWRRQVSGTAPLLQSRWRASRQAPGRCRIPRSRSQRRTTRVVSWASLTNSGWGVPTSSASPEAQPGPGVLPPVSHTSALSRSGRHLCLGWKGSLAEPVCRERLWSCLRDTSANPPTWSRRCCPASSVCAKPHSRALGMVRKSTRENG